MWNMSKSMRMSRQEYSLCKVRNANNNESKNDLKSAWIYPRRTREFAWLFQQPCVHTDSRRLCPALWGSYSLLNTNLSCNRPSPT